MGMRLGLRKMTAGTLNWRLVFKQDFVHFADQCIYLEQSDELELGDLDDSFGQANQVQSTDFSTSTILQQGSGSPSPSSSHSQRGHSSFSHPQQGSAGTVSRQPGEIACTEAATPAKPPAKKTPHSEPEWLESLNKYFLELIVEGCSAMTRRAVENNELLQVSTNHDIIILSEPYIWILF